MSHEPPRVAYVWSARLQQVADALPANIGRSSVVHGLIRALKLVDFENSSQSSRVDIVPPDPSLGTNAELRRYHDSKYIDYLLNPPNVETDSDSDASETSTRARKRCKEAAGLEHDCPPFRCLGEYTSLVAAATLTACRILAQGEYDTVIVWDGGRHHALRARASGFCYVADAVLGILLLCREGVPRQIPAADAATPRPTRRPRVLYIDMDLHYGDGVASAFASPTHYPYPLKGRPRPPQVLTLSIHHTSPLFFPPGAPGLTPEDTPHPFSLSLPLAAFAHAPSYVRAWTCVEKIYDAWKPDYVVLQLGVDGLPGDSIGQWGAWSITGAGSTTWVVEQVKAWAVPTCVLGGGGYEHANAARAWALATAALVERDLPPETDVPDHDHIEEYAPSFILEVQESKLTCSSP